MKTIRAVHILLLLCTSVQAQWRLQGVPIVDTVANRSSLLPQIAEDGAGGGIVCWRDSRSGQGRDIYAQRTDSNGVVQWQINGIPICTAPLSQNFPRMISDGEGGAIIAWEDDRDTMNTRIFAQKVSRSGQVLWQQNGVLVSLKSGLFVRPVSDGQGGVIIAWKAADFVLNYDQVYCQRLNAQGARMWGDSGVQISSRAGVIPSNDVAIAMDGSGGANVAWVQGTRVFCQSVNQAGAIRWIANGREISDRAYDLVSFISIAPTTRGGAIIDWFDPNSNNYAQRIDSSGGSKWQANGLLIAPSQFTGGGGGRRILADSSDGAFIGHGLRIQHVDSLGRKLWDANGVVFSVNPGTNSVMVNDLGGGVINAWEGFVPNANVEILAQRIDSTGTVRWQANGVRFGIDSTQQRFPQAVSDRRGGAIVVWDDLRSIFDPNIPDHYAVYAQRISSNGVIVTSVAESDHGHVLPAQPTLEQNYPNPFNPTTIIRYDLPKSGNVKLTVCDVLGRDVRILLNERKESGKHVVKWDGRTDAGRMAASGVYFYGLQFNGMAITHKMILIH